MEVVEGFLGQNPGSTDRAGRQYMEVEQWPRGAHRVATVATAWRGHCLAWPGQALVVRTSWVQDAARDIKEPVEGSQRPIQIPALTSV